ncbi:1-aminocyclopropane-1-carboxylate deaminase/D-cysteine desulfhydrase [Candidatus Enterococcus murrayae]|uniref:Pyridoxal-phosphate dependent enzyme n=1 Tax=Candidatus Enterococcus murrayae TaxID=2815321 RepID=A0ABS3HKI4_9ENTE|nr:pyridoxal-phosphate dependent enzyme [Enterococcus sp. MJM16]MBO0453527.1 pyridoxal-phosphate dependent enzyme [Enterococcus sp. MJM16]
METTGVKQLLKQKPKASLGFYPTPFYRLENLSKRLGINLFIKREDFSGQSLFGGNKIRKLEYLIGDAKEQGAEYIFTFGATQSNHAMQTVEACRKEGLTPILYLVAYVEPDEKDLRSNLLLDKILGAEVHVILKNPGESDAEVDARSVQLAREHMKRLIEAGHNCYEIPMGGASPIGTTGFIEGFIEMAEQAEAAEQQFDYLVHATGSGGTMAGLVAGKKLLNHPMRILSFDVIGHDRSYLENSAMLANKSLALLGLEERLTADDFEHDNSYYQPGYEMPSDKGNDAIRVLAREEGLFLDPVYSGKAFAGLLDYVDKGIIPQNSSVIFLHTGGATALFAEKEILGDLLDK